MRKRVTICFGMTSDLMRKWRESFKPMTERSNSKPMQTRIAFDTQVKTALICINNLNPPTAPPKIFEPKSPVNVLSGSWTELPCNVTGNPKPTVSWFLHDVPIDVSDPKYLILPSGSLRIFGVTPSDSGTYSCMASNPLGVARNPVELSVQGKNN